MMIRCFLIFALFFASDFVFGENPGYRVSIVFNPNLNTVYNQVYQNVSAYDQKISVPIEQTVTGGIDASISGAGDTRVELFPESAIWSITPSRNNDYNVSLTPDKDHQTGGSAKWDFSIKFKNREDRNKTETYVIEFDVTCSASYQEDGVHKWYQVPPKTLKLTCVVYKDERLQVWTSGAQNLRVQLPKNIPGQVMFERSKKCFDESETELSLDVALRKYHPKISDVEYFNTPSAHFELSNNVLGILWNSTTNNYNVADFGQTDEIKIQIDNNSDVYTPVAPIFRIIKSIKICKCKLHLGVSKDTAIDFSTRNDGKSQKFPFKIIKDNECNVKHVPKVIFKFNQNVDEPRNVDDPNDLPHNAVVAYLENSIKIESFGVGDEYQLIFTQPLYHDDKVILARRGYLEVFVENTVEKLILDAFTIDFK